MIVTTVVQVQTCLASRPTDRKKEGVDRRLTMVSLFQMVPPVVPSFTSLVFAMFSRDGAKLNAVGAKSTRQPITPTVGQSRKCAAERLKAPSKNRFKPAFAFAISTLETF